MTPEGKIKKAVKAIMQEYAKKKKLWYFMPVPYMHAGIPDFVVCVGGKFLGIETKAGDGRMTALQQRTCGEIIGAGGETICINEDRLELLRSVLDSMVQQ